MAFQASLAFFVFVDIFVEFFLGAFANIFNQLISFFALTCGIRVSLHLHYFWFWFNLMPSILFKSFFFFWIIFIFCVVVGRVPVAGLPSLLNLELCSPFFFAVCRINLWMNSKTWSSKRVLDRRVVHVVSCNVRFAQYALVKLIKIFLMVFFCFLL